MLRPKNTLLSLDIRLVITRQKFVWSAIFGRANTSRSRGWPTKSDTLEGPRHVWIHVYIEITSIVESYSGRWFLLADRQNRKGERTGTQKDGGIWWSVLSVSMKYQWFTRKVHLLMLRPPTLLISDLHRSSACETWFFCLSNLYWY